MKTKREAERANVMLEIFDQCSEWDPRDGAKHCLRTQRVCLHPWAKRLRVCYVGTKGQADVIFIISCGEGTSKMLEEGFSG